jgi:hypothetical protein
MEFFLYFTIATDLIYVAVQATGYHNEYLEFFVIGINAIQVIYGPPFF